MSDIIDLSQYPAPPYFNDETLDAIIQAHFDYIEHQEGIPLDKGNATRPPGWSKAAHIESFWCVKTLTVMSYRCSLRTPRKPHWT